MPFLLLTFLAVALVVTLVGLFLSSKNHAGDEPAVDHAERGNYRFIGPARARAGAAYRNTGPVRTRVLARSTNVTIPTLFDHGRRSDSSSSLMVIIIGLISVFVLSLYTL